MTQWWLEGWSSPTLPHMHHKARNTSDLLWMSAVVRRGRGQPSWGAFIDVYPPAPRPSSDGAGPPMCCLRVPTAHVTHLQDVREWCARGWGTSPSHLALWDICDPNCSPLAPTDDPLLFLKNRGAPMHAAWALDVIRGEEERGVSEQVIWRFQGGPVIVLPLLPWHRLGALVNAVLPAVVREKFGPLRLACPSSSWGRMGGLEVPIAHMAEVTLEGESPEGLAGGGHTSRRRGATPRGAPLRPSSTGTRSGRLSLVRSGETSRRSVTRSMTGASTPADPPGQQARPGQSGLGRPQASLSMSHATQRTGHHLRTASPTTSPPPPCPAPSGRARGGGSRGG
jgi:hypothetical protein